MAEEEKNEEQTQEKKKSSKLVLIIIGVLLVLILVIGGVVAMLLLSDDGAQQTPQAQQNTQQNSGGSAASRVSADDLQVGPMFPLETFTVNLLSDSGRRYLKTELNLEMSTPSLQAELNSKMPIIRDTVIGVLSSKTVEEISTRRGKERLKEEIIEQINTRLQDGYVTRIYFMMFIIQ